MSFAAELVGMCLDDDDRRNARRYRADIASEWRHDWERKAACPMLWLSDRSAATPRTRERWVDTVSWPATNGEKARRWEMASMVAARELFSRGTPLNPKGRKPPRLPWRNDALPLFDWAMVEGYFDPSGPRRGDWTVVDVDWCHYAIIAAATLDGWFRMGPDEAHYSPGRVELLRADELDDRNVGRALSGMFARRKMEWLRFGERQVIPHSNFCSPDMVGLVHATVQAIAWDAVEAFGARHVCADAVTLPTARAAEWRHHLAVRWGLASHVVASGRGYLYGWNHWRIGGETRNQYNRPAVDEGPFSNLVAMSPALRESLATLRRRLLERERHEAPWPAQNSDAWDEVGAVA